MSRKEGLPLTGRGGEVSAVGRVVAVHGSRVRVRVQRDRSCGRVGPCPGGADCQLPLTAGWREVEAVAEDPDLTPGDAVLVTIDSRHLTRGWALVFGLPLVGAMGGALTGHWLTGSDLGTAAGMGLGLVVAWWQARQIARRLPPPAYRVTRHQDDGCADPYPPGRGGVGPIGPGP